MYNNSRSPSEPVNNVTIVEVINHNQVFDFNQMDRVLVQTNHQSPQTSSESSMNSPRSSRPTNSSMSENAIVSPRSSSRHHQIRNMPTVEETASGASRSSSHSESNDRTASVDDLPQRSTSEVQSEGQRVKTRLVEPEDNRPRRRPKRPEVLPAATDLEATSNYEHLVLPTAIQPRQPPLLANFVPTDIAILPTRPQVNFNQIYIFQFKCYLLFTYFVVTNWPRSGCSPQSKW